MVVADYEVDQATCEADISALLEELQREKLVEIAA